MKTIALFICLLALFPKLALCAGLPPWHFGMSKAEVVDFKEFGPYREFKNGDVETFNGKFFGQKENIQFFFDNRGLRRIGAYLYEGRNVKEAMAAWKLAYEVLKRNFGEIETPDIKVSKESDPVDAEVLAIAAASEADTFGKSQMAPRKQPSDMLVFSTFARRDLQVGRFYYVIVYFDRL